MPNLLTILGTLICGLVTLQLLLMLIGLVLRMVRQRRVQRLAMQRSITEIELLRQRHDSDVGQVRWEGYRKFRVHRKVKESANCHSIYLVPHDGKLLPRFAPGQFLTFLLRIPGEEKPLVRCYSLSDCFRKNYYRCTIKQVLPPPSQPELPSGRGSTYMNEVVREGDILDVRSPRGTFVLDMSRADPIVLLAGGIGITPLLSMLNAVIDAGTMREVHLFYGVRNSGDYPFQDHLRRIAQEYPNIRVHTVFSQPLDTDRVGHGFDSTGYVTVDLLTQHLASNNYEFFVCGPPPFMTAVEADLRTWGVPQDRVHTEAFGAGSLPKTPTSDSASEQPDEQATGFKITFARTGQVMVWNGKSDSLLDFAESSAVGVESGCRAGNCGTCLTAIKSGKVRYLEKPDTDIDEGSCLLCVCVPDGDLVLDA